MMGNIMENIASKQWIPKGEIQDIMMIMHILNEHRTLFSNDELWQHIEAVAMH